MESIWRATTPVAPIVIEALWAVIHKLAELIRQISRTKFEISVQNSAILGTAKTLHRTLRFPGFW